MFALLWLLISTVGSRRW